MIADLDQLEVQRVEKALSPKLPVRRGQFRRALWVTLLVPATVYVAVFALAAGLGPGLRSLNLSKFGPILDYGYEARGVDADVLIYGDSSAFLGIDPRLVNQELGTRSAVLPNTIGSLPLTRDLALRRYLEHNRRPRVLVLYFAPWNLDYERGKKEFLLEGEEEILRYGSWREIARAVRSYPLQFLVFPFQTLEPVGMRQLVKALRHEDAERGPETARAFGHWDYILPYPALSAECRLRPEYEKSMPHDLIRHLKQKYEAQGMQVIVYLAPIPGCSDSTQVAKDQYGDLQAAPPLVLPPGWFADDSFTAHIRPEHVRETSLIFADRLRALGAFPVRSLER